MPPVVYRGELSSKRICLTGSMLPERFVDTDAHFNMGISVNIPCVVVVTKMKRKGSKSVTFNLYFFVLSARRLLWCAERCGAGHLRFSTRFLSLKLSSETEGWMISHL